MDMIIKSLAEELGQKESYIENVVMLLDEGNTIPFIARYRKEMHGSMDDTTLRNLETRLNYLRNLQERKNEMPAQVHVSHYTPTKVLSSSYISEKDVKKTNAFAWFPFT